MTQVRGKKVLVMGLGRFGGGVGVTKWLVEQGAKVTVTDLKTEEELKDSVAKLKGLDVRFMFCKHDSNDVKNADLIILNPAVKPDSPYLELAGKHRVPWTTEVNLFLERCPAKVIGVTGTNGKETVVRMIELVLRDQVESRRVKVWVGGNIGKSLLDDLGQIRKNDIVILELSSFQLAWLPIIRYSPDVAVVINITPDHLDWHKTMRAYLDSKANILRYQTKGDVAIFNWTSPRVCKFAAKAKGTVVKVLKPARVTLSVPGRFNKMNVSVAAAVCSLFHVPRSTSNRVIRQQFKGVPHALEYVGERRGVTYYNDSAATTSEATIAALESFRKPVILIVGGYDKYLPLTSLLKAIKNRTKAAYTIGQTGSKLHELLRDRSIHATTLERAVGLIKQQARPGDIVLLSPAAASYDQFKNLEQRGEIFRSLVLQ